MMIFAAVLIYAGVYMITLGSRQMSAALQIPMKYIYVILPISGALIILYLLKSLCDAVAERR
jgi:TRAP-type C4-dicarboxylate transport system permease small subunit